MIKIGRFYKSKVDGKVWIVNSKGVGKDYFDREDISNDVFVESFMFEHNKILPNFRSIEKLEDFKQKMEFLGE